MAEEDIQKLHSEIESLRKENRQLKIAAFQQLEKNRHGIQEEAPVIEKEPILKVLGRQLDDLKRLNAQVKNMLDGYREVQRSLGAILPALELQMEGWTNEVHNLKQHIEDSESAYAMVVTQLEQKLKESRKASPEVEKLQQEIDHYKALVRAYKSKLPNSEDREEEDPFTDLNIFGS